MMTVMKDRKRRSPAARIPPPLLFAASLALGLYLQRGLVLGLTRTLPQPWRLAAILLVAAGILLAVWAVGLFARHRTTLIPHGVSSVLIIHGPYRFTRNPMYLSLSLAYLGLALWLQCWIALPLLTIPVGILGLVIIPMEESQMRERFGDTYDVYCSRVRRWL
jgi:protein-S-isoprenylcysteine O-methyltransferase Ste14